MLVVVLLLIAFFAIPVVANAWLDERPDDVPWYQARRDPTGLAPEPRRTPEAVVQVYAARAVAWRGIFSVHGWIVVKPAGAESYTRYEVVGFGVANGAPALRIDRTGPDNYWFGAMPTLLADRRGPAAEAMIPRIRDAVGRYPYPHRYRAWPGPNSNTFLAFIAREVPDLGLALPANALGKDFLPGAIFARAPSGTGFQLSLYGLLGFMAALREGVEFNLLGLTVGIDVEDPALKLPGIGRIGRPSRQD
ncbi:MAG TPA: DUF3750 domain-containing protein [Stellaceae bacterium]|nr:DUF3750 domain-containing protein [Stellaceae bacterium]